MGMDEKSAMKKLVVSALAYYGLKVFHVFDGREFKACLKPIDIDRQKAVEEFTEIVNATSFEIVDKFEKEFCRPDPCLSTSAAQPRELQSQMVPETVLRLVAPMMAVQGNRHSSSSGSRIWATLSTFVKDYSGHYVAPYRDGKCVNVEEKVNNGVQLQGKLKVAKAEIRTGNTVQNTNVNRPPAAVASLFPYSPTKDYSSLRRDGGRQCPMRKRDAAHHEESEHCEAKRLRPLSVGEKIEETRRIGSLQEESEHCDARLRVQSAGEEIEKEEEPGTWRENLAKEWPHIFQEIQEHVNTEPKQTEMEEKFKCAYPPCDLPTLIEEELVDLHNMQEPPYLERKRKRERATDEKASGGTVLNDSSLETIGRLKDQMNHVEALEGDPTICAGNQENNVESEVGSSHITLDTDLEVTGQKRNRTSWPAPLYGDQTRAKSSLQSFEHRVEGDICSHELQGEEDTCAHELQGEALDSCLVCRRKEEISFAKYARLFKDDPSWKQKFLDGENLTCDICSSKGKITTFSDVSLLLSHARKGLELRGPEHRGYAKAIYSLTQLSDHPGNLRTCHSAIGQTTRLKAKRVWPPVIVLENTFKASDRCSHLKDLDKEVRRRLEAFVNVEEHTLHKVKVNGFFQGTILVEFPPTQRGLNDANRLHQHFLLTGRSLQEWIRVRNKPLALMLCATGVQEICDLVKIGESGEIRSRIYFGYLGTVKIMTRLDPGRQLVKWRVREANIVGN